MTVNRSPTYDLSSIYMLQCLAAQMYADQRDGVSGFVGGNQTAATSGSTPVVGRITPTYDCFNSIPGNLRATAGLPSTSTLQGSALLTTTVTEIERTIRGVLDVLGRLQH